MGCHVCGSVEHKRRDCPLRAGAVAKESDKAVTGKKAGVSRGTRWVTG